MTELREQIARAIHEECSGYPWPDGGTAERVAEREHWLSCADRVLEVLDDDPRHVIEVREDGWTLKHPLACRHNLFDCPVNRVAEQDLTPLDGPPAPPGRYECEVNDLGDRFLLGDRIEAES